MSEHDSVLARRSFLATLTTATSVTVIGAATAPSAEAQASGTVAAPQSTAAVTGKWQPARHPQDDWLDQVPGQHRFVFDTTATAGMDSALTFATNYYLANASGYGLKDSDLAVVIVARHLSTPFAFNDAIWAKYGAPISSFVDPTKEPAKANAHLRRLNGLLGRGMHLAVCGMASRAIAGSIARAVGSSQDEIYAEILANLLPNSHITAAGIVAVNRAQERGYAFVHGVSMA